MNRKWGRYAERGITGHGPSYQFECHACPTCGLAVVELKRGDQ